MKYERILFGRYQNCRQAGRSISEYTTEFHCLQSRNNLNESEDQLIVLFVGRLTTIIQDKLTLNPAVTLESLIKLAEHAVHQAAK